MRPLATRRFAKAAKKLHPAQKSDLDRAVATVLADPALGEEKKADLSGVRVYKFRMQGQPILLAYQTGLDSLTLLAFGPHENFYRDLKKGRA
jgi:mRNA interferase RelE/StbE